MNKKNLNLNLYLYYKFFHYFSSKQKVSTIFTFVLGLFSTFLELISIGMVLPFVLLITNPEKIYELSFYKIIFSESNYLIDELIFFSIVVFIAIIIISTFFKIIHLKLNCLVSFDITRTFGDILFRKVLNQKYRVFEDLNTKDVVTTLSIRSQSIGESNFFIITLLSSVTTIFFLLINIIYFAPFKIIWVLFSLGFLYFIFWRIIKNQALYLGKIYSENFEKMNKNISEMMNSYADIILYRLHDFFSIDFEKNNSLLRKSQARIVFINGFPPIAIQSIVFTTLVVFIFFFYSYGILNDQLPFLVFLLFSIQRLIPNAQTILFSCTNLLYSQESLKKSFLLLNLKSKNKKKINKKFINKIQKEEFNRINLKNIKFNFFNKKKNIIFNNFNLQIKKGEKIALIGESGSGKSTLLKIILGFLKPISGSVFLNRRKYTKEIEDWWHSIVAYIPQKIFIIEDNLYKNIALKQNISKKEKEEIDRLIIMLNLSDLLSFSKKNLTISVGEGGKKFSGGQIQRIAVARALFQNRKFLIFDEAFNALDNDNIVNIMNILNKIPSLTLLVITHSDVIAKQCNKIIKIENKKIHKINIS
jgi:ABC-type multidrug transport system fused ATPase/permease subunit